MTELAAYYRQYHETMKHWHRVLPGKVLDVHYEETVTDLETQVRRILAHCGLPFEEACVRFHENTARGEDGELRAGPPADLHAMRSATGAATKSTSSIWQEELARHHRGAAGQRSATRGSE